jgi:predicted lipid-binding transport protein (Tim44 family)
VDRTEVYVPRERPAANPATPARRPVPVAQEALMYPVDRSEMSAARAQMMARRRRSLGLLGLGTVVFGVLGGLVGGVFLILTAPFVLGLAGYLYFLRSQALRDRQRRSVRQERASRRTGSYDVTSEISRFDDMPESVVRIDDDDLELHNLDTVDLTGLYSEEAGEAAAQRRAS